MLALCVLIVIICYMLLVDFLVKLSFRSKLNFSACQISDFMFVDIVRLLAAVYIAFSILVVRISLMIFLIPIHICLPFEQGYE